MVAVRAYQKLIYAPAKEQESLALEYQSVDKTGQNTRHSSESEVANINTESGLTVFDPGLVPETTEIYPINGAEIRSFRILDAKDQVVNVLQPGQDYRFEVSGRFLSDNDKVFFVIHIRSISGTVITGQRYPSEGNFVERVRTGENFCISYGFRMILLPGVYFVGGGVWSSNEPSCLHRILDALMFRVTPNPGSTSFGYIDASSMEPSLEVL
jgi:lipopolysaccharide transport system ATP-binding protein